MTFRTDQPLHKQILEELSNRIIEGVWKEGCPISSVRTMATEWNVNPITVAKAYHVLVEAGVLLKNRGIEMSVASGALEILRQQQRQHILEHEWPCLLAKIKRLGIEISDLPTTMSVRQSKSPP